MKNLLTALVLALFSLQTFAAGISDLELPAIGESSHQGFSLKRQKKLGHEAYQQLKRYGYILNDQESTAYIQALGRKIAAAAPDWHPDDFTFFIVNSPSVNAFAMPGGYIGINAGLIALADTEEELAGVMAHEVAHVTQQHIARLVETTKPMQIATAAAILAALVLGAHDPEVAQIVLASASAVQYEQQVKFTRIHEHEADRVAVSLLENANISPIGLPTFFEKMRRKSHAYSQKYADFFRTHPYSHERVTETAERIKQTLNIPLSTEPLFSLMRERVRVISTPTDNDPLQHYSTDKNNNDLANQYGKALALQRSSQYKLSYKKLKTLLRNDPNNLVLLLATSRAAANSGRINDAIALLDTTLKQYPGHQLVMYRQAELALALGKSQQALHWLQLLRSKRPNSPEIQSMLARAAADLDLYADAHIYKANSLYLVGAERDAIHQLKQALKSEQLTKLDLQRIQARLDELKNAD